MSIKTVYEVTELSPSDVEVYEAKGGNVGVRFSIDHKAEARAVLYPHTALSLKRGLARLVDADVADPNEGGWSLGDLFKARNYVQRYIKDGGVVDQEHDERVLAIINAYIRMIERVVQASEASA